MKYTTAHETTQRDALLIKHERDTRRWSKHVDTMLRALRSEDASPALRVKVEELRNKRDSLETKAEALKRHRLRGWANAQREFEEARSELKTTWRTVIGRLDRESLFI